MNSKCNTRCLISTLSRSYPHAIMSPSVAPKIIKKTLQVQECRKGQSRVSGSGSPTKYITSNTVQRLRDTKLKLFEVDRVHIRFCVDLQALWAVYRGLIALPKSVSQRDILPNYERGFRSKTRFRRLRDTKSKLSAVDCVRIKVLCGSTLVLRAVHRGFNAFRNPLHKLVGTLV